MPSHLVASMDTVLSAKLAQVSVLVLPLITGPLTSQRTSALPHLLAALKVYALLKLLVVHL